MPCSISFRSKALRCKASVSTFFVMTSNSARCHETLGSRTWKFTLSHWCDLLMVAVLRPAAQPDSLCELPSYTASSRFVPHAHQCRSAAGQFPAIPSDNRELEIDNTNTPADLPAQALSDTAEFHSKFMEQGGSSLYPSLAWRVTRP